MVQVEFHLFDGLGRQNRAIYTTFSYVIAANARASNRPGGTLISAADGSTGRNRTGGLNKQLLPLAT